MSVVFTNKEFKDVLSTFCKLSSHTSNTHNVPISFGFDPFRMVMVTDYSFVSSVPNATVSGQNSPYTFNPEILLGLTYSEGNVELSWENDASALSLKNNYLSTSLRVALPAPQFDAFPDKIDSFEIPLGLLASVKKYLEIPFVFYNGKKELTPIRFFKNDKGMLSISADDGFSIARITTQIPVSLPIDIKIPKYILDCLYSKNKVDDKTKVKMGIHGLKFMLTNGSFQIYSSSLSDETSDFDLAIKEFKSKVTLEFTPSLLALAIKPLISILPKKDRSGSIISFKVFDQEKKVSMSTNHIDVGTGSIDFVEGISNIHLDNEARFIAINMHPAAFFEYTSLLDIDTARMFADNRMAYYKGQINTGDTVSTLEYIFPTVQV